MTIDFLYEKFWQQILCEIVSEADAKEIATKLLIPDRIDPLAFTANYEVFLRKGMSDQQIGKKENERSDLNYFLDAYEFTTGEKLIEFASSECPDFICVRSNGEKVGVELVCVMRNPEEAQFDIIVDKKFQADSQETLDEMFRLLDEKDKKRSNNYGHWADKTILVLQLSDCTILALQSFLNDMKSDFADYGFVEIWLADYTGVEAYRDIELFGLVPDKWWGYHQRQNPYRKPYG